MPALHAKTPLIFVAKARGHSSRYGGALRRGRVRFDALFGQARNIHKP
ncbi:hypothetical protein [Thiomonas intermedia]|nr:hypothetical protein [Thiomonas intermedia]